jgi:insulysin
MDNLNKFQYFDVYQTVNDKRDIKGIILNNGIKIVLVSDKDIIISACSIAVNAGYLEDEYEGTAHFLEHLLFMGSEKFPSQNEYHSYVSVCGGMDNAYTAENITCYYLEIESHFMKKGIEMLSWFFKKPLLDMSLIKSEMEIINSEHDKNILSDSWIMDDILKKLIKSSKYTNFGTGCNESLKNITKEDILKFYNKYYTTDNIYVCIVDSKPIDEMINDYIIYFNEIEEKRMLKDALTIDKIKLVNENLIIYKSVSKYNFFNIMLFADCTRKNEEQYIIINFINYLLGVEYTNSLSYYLKENNLVRNINVNIDYYFDDKAVINIKFILIDEDINKLNEVYSQFYTYLELIKNISENEFKMIYNNYQKIRLLDSMYSDNSISTSDTSNEIIDNMINGKLEYSILKQNYVNNYELSKYNLFKEMLNSLIIKISTNININKKNDFIKSKWYNTSYYLSEYDNINLKKNNKKNNFEYKIENIIGIKNFVIEEFINFNKINKKEIPSLIYKNYNKEIYLLENNKYEKPISTINVIKKNKKLLDNYNNMIMSIYFSLCDKILNYYLEVMSMYHCHFTMQLYNEYLIHNYTGLDYIISDKFMNEINKMTNIDFIFSNENFEKYFLQIKRDFIENLKNSIYDSPHVLCLSYLSHSVKNTLFPKLKIDFIEKLTIEQFKNMLVNECLIYDYEYYIIIGITKNKNNKKINYENINTNNDINYNFNEDSYLKNIINLLSANENRFYKKSIDYELENYNKNVNYILKKDEFNSKDEKNNCVIQFNTIYNKKFIINNNNYNDKFVNSIIKNKIIASMVSQILNEPLFDRIRTIDKLGYIVKCNYMYIEKYDDISIILFYLVQSQYDINKINKSIVNFNKFMAKDIKNNYDLYLEKFNSLKNSRLFELKKPFSTLMQEISCYIDSIISKFYIFNLNKVTYKICKKIKFNDILSVLNIYLNNKSEKYEIILNSKN